MESEVRDAYVESLGRQSSIHSIREEYRAAAAIDREHDQADHLNGHRIRCPLLVLWSERGPLAQWYQNDGGPIGIWRARADDVVGRALPAGHFFTEELPVETALALRTFFSSAARLEAV